MNQGNYKPHEKESRREIKLTYDEGRLDLEVEGDAELAHLVPGGAPVLAPVLRPRVLHQQHVGHGVKPRPVAHRLQQVAVDVKPTGTKQMLGNCYLNGAS